MREGRLFFFAALGMAILSVVIITTNIMPTTVDVPPQVAIGYGVWRENGCIGCHTLYGQGGPYAPDLTHIYAQRGEGYLREFLVNPGAFHPGQRVMPRFGLTVSETDDLLGFLRWAGGQPDAANWPLYTIRVSGGDINGSSLVNEAIAALPAQDMNAAQRGRELFSGPPGNCSTCHALEPDVVIVGPSLAGVATRAENRVRGQSAAEYLRNSILHPGDFIVPGFPDAMARNLGDMLSGDEINDLIAYLLTLE